MIAVERTRRLPTLRSGWGGLAAWLAAVVTFALGEAGATAAPTTLRYVALSSDVTIATPAPGAIDDATVATEAITITPTPLLQPVLPTGTDLDAVHKSGPNTFFSVDTTVLLGAGLPARPADVVAFDGVAYWLEFVANGEGVPAGVNIDAVAAIAGDLLLSFDTTVVLGSGLVIEDEDLVRVEPTQFSLFLDGSQAGIDRSLDVDAASRIGRNGRLLLSFDTGGSIGGIAFDDDDVLEYNPGGGSWELAYDAGAQGTADWGASDVDALWAKGPNKRRCGLGYELALLLAPLLWLHGRRGQAAA